MRTLTDLEAAAVTRYPPLQRLVDLKYGGGWTFVVAPDMVGGCRTLADGWSEAIVIRNLGDVRAYRCDPAGDPVWQHEGGLVDTINGLSDLPAPGAPGAPTLIIGRRPTLWTP